MLRILTYHRVARAEDTPDLNPRMISATPEVFAAQMRLLARKYRVVTMEEVLDAFAAQKKLPAAAVLLTFDDAYCDFGEIAWPILRREKLPATLFVPTGYPDHPERAFWWDRLYRAFCQSAQKKLELPPVGLLELHSPPALHESLKRAQNYVKSLPHAAALQFVEEVCAHLDSQVVARKSVLSWNELRELQREGVTLGAHTVTHPIMTQLSAEQVRVEIKQAQEDLQREAGKTLPIFCYPSGGHDDAVVALLREEGYRLAFTTLDGQNDLRRVDPLRLRRTNITRRTSPALLRIRLMKWAAHVDAWRHR
ncbi:MAG: polysaccharide deacetylase family protein [candidate division KSB1 bacterium]